MGPVPNQSYRTSAFVIIYYILSSVPQLKQEIIILIILLKELKFLNKFGQTTKNLS
jgi:hypothetical protein